MNNMKTRTKVKELNNFSPKDLFNRFVNMHVNRENNNYKKSDEDRDYVIDNYGLSVTQEIGSTRINGVVFCDGVHYSINLNFNTDGYQDKADSLLKFI